MHKIFRFSISGADLFILKAIRTLSVKVRFFLMVIFISIIPIFVIGTISYEKSNTEMISKSSVYTLQIVKQFQAAINDKLLSWEQYGNTISNSVSIQNILQNYDQLNDTDQYLSGKIIGNTMNEALKATLDIQEPDIITAAGKVISPSNYMTTNTSPFVNNIGNIAWIKWMADAQRGRYVWYTDDIVKKGNKGFLVLAHSIVDIATLKKSMGTLMLKVDSNYLYSLYNNINLGSGSQIFVLNSEFRVVLSDDKAEIGTVFYPELSGSLSKQISNGFQDGTIKNADGKYLVAFSTIRESGWIVVALIPNAYMNSLSKDIRDLVIVVGIICLLASLLFFILIYRSITIPLNQLVSSMRKVKKGNLEVGETCQPARDEVGEVTASYNDMIVNIKQHIENIRMTEKQKIMAEFRALQAQINPHFIANTLNNVAWLAKMQKAENIERVVIALNQLLNSSMGRGGDIITIQEDIENIKSYINIQEFKYLKKINIYFEIDNIILNYKILRFILQPIIENSIIHGLGPKQGQGIITLKGYTDNGDIILVITDTGVGIVKEEVKKLLNEREKSRDRFSNIGLENVHERIRLSYGEKYGLLIKSEKGMFTTVEIKLPIIP